MKFLFHIFSLLGCSLAVTPLAQTQTFTSTATTGTASWLAGNGWDVTPSSGTDVVLNFGNGSLLAASAAVIQNNDIAALPFQLNALNMTYAGPASGTAPTVTIQGNQFEFVNSSLSAAPSLVFNTTGTVKPTVKFLNSIRFTTTTAITTTSDGNLAGVLSGAGGFTKSGAGTLIIENNATSSGGTALGNIGVSAGTLQIGNNGGFGSLGSGIISLSGSGSLSVARAANSFSLDNTITGSTSGAVTFRLNNSATPTAFAVTLSKANTYSAPTNLQPHSSASVGTPTLKNGLANALPVSTDFTINTITGATAKLVYDLNGFAQTLGSIATGLNVDTTKGVITNSGTESILTLSKSSGSTTYAGLISGSIALTKADASTQILSGANTYTGATTVAGGTLQAGVANALGSNSAVTLANATGATLALNNFSQTIGSLAGGGSTGGNVSLGSATLTTGGNASSTSYAGVISGTGGLTKTGAGTFTLTGANTYTGMTTVSAGTLDLNTTGGQALAGALTLSGGTARLLQSNQIASGKALVVNSGTFDLQGFDQTHALVQMFGGNLISTSGVLTFSTGLELYGGSLSATLAGTGYLYKDFAGTLTMSRANSFSGETTIVTGVINLQHADGLGTNTNRLLVNDLAALQLQGGITVGAKPLHLVGKGVGGANGALRNISGTNTAAGNITLYGDTRINSDADTLTLSGAIAQGMAGTSLSVGGAGNTILTGNISLSSGYGVTKSDGGTLTLAGTNTYTGATTVSAGTLKLAKQGAVQASTLTVSGGSVVFDSTVAGNAFTAGGLAGTGNLALQNNAGTPAAIALTVGNGNGSASYSGILSGTGSILKSGSGTQTLSGANTYTGTTTVSAGTLTLANQNAVQASTLTLSGGSVVFNSTVVGNAFTAGGLAGTGNLALQNNAGTPAAIALTVGNGNGSASYSGILSGAGSLLKSGTGTQTLTGANTYTGTTTVAAGQLDLNKTAGQALAGNLTVSGGTARLLQSSQIASGKALAVSSGTFDVQGFDQTLAAVQLTGGTLAGTSGVLTSTSAFDLQTGTVSAKLGGAVGLNKTGAGSVTLSGANTYTGTTTISAGVVNLQQAAGLGTTAGGTSVSAGAALQLQGGITVGAEALTLAGNGVGGADGALRNISGNNTFGGLISLGSASRINSDAGTLTLSHPGTITGTNVDLTLGGAGDILMQSIIGTGTGNLVKDGNGTVTLQGSNTYTGATTVSAGTLTLANSDAVQASTLTVSGGNVVFDSTVAGNAFTAGGLAGTGNLALENNAGSPAAIALTVGNGNGSASYSGSLSGAGSLTKSGSGTQTLTGANTYTGTTTVAAGTLDLNKTGGQALAGNLTVSGGTARLLQSSQIASGKALAVSSGTFDVQGFDQTLAAVQLTGGTLAGTSGVLTSTSDFDLQAGTVSAKLGGAVGLNKTGAGSVSLSGANSYTGATTVSAGTLTLANPDAVQASTLTVSGGSVVFDSTVAGNAFTAGGLAGTGNLALENNAGSPAAIALTVGNGNGSASYSGSLSGAGSLTKSGSGTQTLTGANTYTGTTTISGGVVNLQHAAGLGSTAGGTAVAAGAALQLQGGITVGAEALTLAGNGVGGADGALRNISGDNTFGGLISLGSASRINSDAGTLTLSHPGTITGTNVDLTLGGAGDILVRSIISTGTGNLIKDGSGTVTLAGANTFTGTTTINAGTLKLGVANALDSSAAIILANVAGVTLDFNGFNVTLGSISGGGNLGGSISLGSSTLTAGGDNTSTTYASNLSGSGGLTKEGSGTLTLSGTNGYVGATRVSGGTLQAGSSSAFGNASAVSLDDAAGVALDLNDQATTIGSLAGGGTTGGHINLGSATLTTGSLGATTRYAGVISGSGGLTQTGAGTLTLTGTNNYTGATTIASGSTLQIGDGSIDGSIATSSGITNDGALVFNLGSDQTNAFGISGTGTLSKSGAGTLTLSGTNGYTGATTISGGTLAINTAAALGSTAGVNLGNAATLRYTGSASATLDRDLAVTAGTGFLRNSGPGTLTLSGTLSKNGTTLTFAEGLFAVTGSIVGASANSDLVVDAASVILGGANSYTGPTYLRNGASLTANLAGALPTTTRSALVMDDSGTGSSTLSLGADQVAASLSGAATSVVGLGSHTLTVGETGGTSSFAGTLGGSGGRLTKDGSSTLILSGANTYTGATTVGGGTLQAGAVNALSATSAVTLANATGANLALNNFSQTIGSLAGGGSNGGNVSLGSATLTTGGNASSTSYAGVISGSGGFTKTGAGTQTLSGANTYTGTTTVAAGTLALLANSGAALANTSTLVLASGATVSLGAAQQINAAANLTLAGGTLILNGFNQTLGTLDLNANAALNLGGSAELVFADSHGLDWNSAQLNVSNFTIGTTKLRFGTSNAGLTAVQLGLIRFVSFDNAAAQIDANGFLAPVPANFENASSTDSLIATPIAGTTAVSQTGQGTTTLTAAGNTSTGLASVTAGTLVIGTEAGGNWAGDVIVSGTGTLKGRGTITGSVRVESGGNYSPGNSPAIQLILTDLILDSGSRVTLELDGASAGYGAFFHDKSVVSGVVTLNGTLSASTIFSGSNGYVPAFGASHTVITGRELTGRFAAYDFAANATGVSWLPEYTATAVNLYAVPDNYATLSGLNPNQTRIGVALQSLRNAGPFELDQRAALSSRATLFNGLKTKDAAGLRTAYDQLTPEKLIALASATFQSASIQQANVQQRSAELRRFGPAAVSLNGVARPAAAEDYQVKTVIEDGVQYAVAQAQAPRRLGYFASATGAFAAVDASAERLGSFAQTGAGSFGCDYALNENQALGLIVSQSFTDTDFSGGSGSARTTTNRLGVFHAYHHQGFFLTTSGSVGVSDYATKRNLLFLNQTASGETQGFSYGALVAAGYEFKVGDFIMGPTASIAYDHAQVDGFNETGSAADLQLGQQNSHSLLTQAGFRVSRPLRWKNIGWVPALSLGVSRQLFNPNTITAQLAAGGTPFSVKPQAGGHAYINPGASLEAIMANGITLRLSYDAIVNKDTAEHRVNFSVGAGF